ncbi:protein of unknown function (plasmid) [Cupriavidus taiwanensis]|uniref:Uncharacterized protein n=1 Tax=Cupriavidus taiwanensis TaxID=164546 RepID=A0A7Z7JE21_9BURK|nr:protein of unknown function [Cupriavidus taiwanensis]SPC23476.1 protein of unknown function [Cupriavidus taiwanensis]SPD54803.1 protein of unknown function [Cupriavidus taiwanensis]
MPDFPHRQRNLGHHGAVLATFAYSF